MCNHIKKAYLRWKGEEINSKSIEKVSKFLTIETMHKSKGAESDIVILHDADALPFVHPDYVFEKIF